MGRINDFGPGPRELLVNEPEARRRLRLMLGDKLLRFNPYSVDDRTLIDCAMRGRWLPFPSITQMVIVHFGEITYRVQGVTPDYISVSIGNDPARIMLPVKNLIIPSTYLATFQPVRTRLNDHNITSFDMVESMQGKSYFVSHMIPARAANGVMLPACRFYSLRGNLPNQAEQIRSRMIQSKLSMLEEVISHPYCTHYLRPRFIKNSGRWGGFGGVMFAS